MNVRKPLILLLLAAGAVSGCLRPKVHVTDRWYHGASGYERAVNEQKASGKPILLYFHTDWCGWCKKLESDVFTSNAFDSRFGSALKVKVNPDDSRAERELTSRYGVRGYPTVYVIAGGEARQPVVGYLPADEYVAALQAAAGE